MRDGPYKRKQYDELALCAPAMSYKCRLLECNHFRGVLPAFAGEKPILQNEPENTPDPPSEGVLSSLNFPRNRLAESPPIWLEEPVNPSNGADSRV